MGILRIDGTGAQTESDGKSGGARWRPLLTNASGKLVMKLTGVKVWNCILVFHENQCVLLLFKFVDVYSQNWWSRGLNSVRRAGEWPWSIMDDAGSCFNGPKLEHLVCKFKGDGETIYNSRPQGSSTKVTNSISRREAERDDDYQRQGLSLSTVNYEKSAGAQTLEEHQKTYETWK